MTDSANSSNSSNTPEQITPPIQPVAIPEPIQNQPIVVTQIDAVPQPTEVLPTALPAQQLDQTTSSTINTSIPSINPTNIPVVADTSAAQPLPAAATSTTATNSSQIVGFATKLQALPKPILAVGLVAFGLVIWGIWYRAAFYFRPAGPSGIKVSPMAPVQVIIPEDLSKYDVDTDGDKIPDFVEVSLGTNPKVDEITACYTDACADASLQQGQVKKKNILLIVDGSGSMNLAAGSETKMAAAKRAVANFVNTSGGNAEIGIMTYGYKGSNSPADKAVSCASADVIAPLGSVTATTASGYIDQLKPVGWTPIGLALKNAATAFVGKETDINQVIVLTDGAETCDSNPTAAAQALADGPAKVKVNVIGFGITLAEQTGLQQISQAGKGSFVTANSGSELDDVFKKQWENYAAVKTELNCKLNANTTGITCGGEIFKKVSAYQLENSRTAVGKSPAEHARLSKMLTDFSNYKTQVMTQKGDEFANTAKDRAGKLFK